MQISNIENRRYASRESGLVNSRSFEDITPREMVLGHLAWIALLALAILLRWLG